MVIIGLYKNIYIIKIMIIRMGQKQITISEEIHEIIREQAFEEDKSMRKVVDSAVKKVYED
jgi:hypothetical protein